MANQWIQNKIFINETETEVMDSFINNYEFKKDGEFILNVTGSENSIDSYKGWWKFHNSEKDLIVHTPEHLILRKKVTVEAHTDTLKILKLKKGTLVV